MRILQLLLVAILASLLGACAVSPEGFRIPLPSPDANSTAELARNIRNASIKSGARMALIDPLLVAEDRPGIVTIGGLGPMRRLDEEGRAAHYRSLAEQVQRDGLLAPQTTEGEFVAGTVGFASVFFDWGVLSLQKWVYAVVPNTLAEKLHPPSAFMTTTFGTTGDLVVAHTHQDGWHQIVAVLCDDTLDDYRECARTYRPGRYDRLTGYELSFRNVILRDGVRIDTRTYRVIPREATQ